MPHIKGSKPSVWQNILALLEELKVDLVDEKLGRFKAVCLRTYNKNEHQKDAC